ncbi:MAG: hypothetical protein KKH83_04300, partial [Candidatus Margulisbacteria bacterium]|nr:hypothetical protein [Candidatus Margulisiibacteriota bacterium]
RYTFYKDSLVKVEYIPIEIKNLCQPVVAGEKLSKAILGHMLDSSRNLAYKLKFLEKAHDK